MGIEDLVIVLLSTNILVQNVRVLLGERCLKHQFLQQQEICLHISPRGQCCQR
jgi:hypothetical protein